MNRYASKFVGWLQLGLMFYVVLFFLSILVEYISPNKLVASFERANSCNCFVKIYDYTAKPKYSAFVCIKPNSEIAILRIYPTDPVTYTANSFSDIVVFVLLFTSGIVLWIGFFLKMIKIYVPWL